MQPPGNEPVDAETGISAPSLRPLRYAPTKLSPTAVLSSDSDAQLPAWLEAAVRGAVFALPLVLLAVAFWQKALSGPSLLVSLFTIMVLLFVRLHPVVQNGEFPLDFTEPVVFAATLWAGPHVAALSALTSCLLHARFAPRQGRSRHTIRLEGGILACCAYFASQALLIAELTLRLPVKYPFFLAGNQSGFWAQAICAAGFSAAAFLSAHLILGQGTLWRCRIQRGSAKPLARLRTCAVGMLPVIALSPLATWPGLTVVVPLSVIWWLTAVCIYLRRQSESLLQQLKTAQTLGQASIRRTESRSDPTTLLSVFLEQAEELVKSQRSLVWTMHPETGELTPAVGRPDLGLFNGQKFARDEGIIGHCARLQKPRRIPNAAHDPRRGRREGAMGAWLLFPILVNNRTLGVAQWVRSVNQPFTEDEVHTLKTLVPLAAVALENVRIREEMHDLALTDGLTGLWNKQKMHEVLRYEVDRVKRSYLPLSVLMMDVDSFKSFNDTYGHPAGDELLRSIASVLSSTVRTVDYVGRFGGEEFIVVLPETSKADAHRLAERIRTAVDRDAYVEIDGMEAWRTVSIGIASVPEDGLNPQELIQRADEALYRAKRSGKNRVL